MIYKMYNMFGDLFNIFLTFIFGYIAYYLYNNVVIYVVMAGGIPHANKEWFFNVIHSDNIVDKILYYGISWFAFMMMLAFLFLFIIGTRSVLISVKKYI